MVFSEYTKQRILSVPWRGYQVGKIVECLVLEDNIKVSRQGVRQFLKHFTMYKTIARKPCSGHPPKLSPEVQQIIEQAMREDDETTATQLQSSYDIYVSLAVRNRLNFGGIFEDQLIVS